MQAIQRRNGCLPGVYDYAEREDASMLATEFPKKGENNGIQFARSYNQIDCQID